MSTVDNGDRVFAVVIEGRGRLRRHLASAAAAAAEAFPAARLLLAVETEDLGSETVATLVADGVAHLVAPLPLSLADLTADLHRLWLLWHIDGAGALPEAPYAGGGAGAAADGEPLMVGDGAAMREAFARIRRFAATDVPVLVTGESGTGKELAARAIHERSTVAGGPFVAINCGGIPADLVAAELFGHEKGAFTGAHQRRPGRIEMADGGTLFLDEIGDFPMHLQPHLLRFLQEGTFERVGGLETLRINTRIIAATNVDLEAAVESKTFRRDLFFRLNVLRLHLPPLRERGDDVTLLARYYIDHLRHAHGKPLARLTPEALVAIRNHPWPGNVRQLISALRRGLTLCRRGRITTADLGIDDDPAAGSDAPPPSLEAARAEAEKAAVLSAMRYAHNRPSGAAAALGISRVTLYSLMKKHDLARRFELKTRR
ncbi:sigma-54 interaction domain-containing protein [Caenispirillum salinarum]|uniref:sigma-54 interaction domain-containing protein n=1 Tax=Caenispirillum salinarum TaxID=859058 RepID=UPI00384AAB00